MKILKTLFLLLCLPIMLNAKEYYNEFLMQKTDEKFEFSEEIDLLRKLFEN